MNKALAIQILEDLVKALENSYISSWQTTAGWQQQLDAARKYIDELNRVEK